ncbi:MAG: NADP-dependent malic enzyme [Candidatus Omnitrophica bacterium]|nr:NADP-dependent malic enzyme [Candidatus Omnitrophota bacterium]
MDYFQESLALHLAHRGKIEVCSKVALKDKLDLSLAYTPGVAAPCKEIEQDPRRLYDYTSKGNMVAVVTDGSAVLGLGNIGPEASLPVMEGKAILFKEFGGIDAFPIAIASQDVEEIIRTVVLISPGFGGINLEDISAPRCFLIEERLKKELNIPVFHDDQHGTAVVTYAALLNSLKVVGKKKEEIKAVISGAGAAGIAIAKFLIAAGVTKIIVCDRRGAIYEGRSGETNTAKEEISRLTNREKLSGSLSSALTGADVFIGVSVPGLVTAEDVKNMAARPIVLAMANPIPEIPPDEAKKAGAAIVATGRSDYANQVNNLLAFPGIFKGAFLAKAGSITEEMKIAASLAIAALVSDKELSPDYIIPSPLDRRVADAVAEAVKTAALQP